MERDKFFSPLRPESGAPAGGPPALSSRALARCSSAEARACLPYAECAALKVLPLGIMNLAGRRVLAVAGLAGVEIECAAALRFATGFEIKFTAVAEEVLLPAIFTAYHGDTAALAKRANELGAVSSAITPPALPAFNPPSGEAAQFIAALIEHAIALSASDLHIVPRIDGCVVRVRVEGRLCLREEPVCSLALHRQIINRLKILAGLDTTQTRRPQDGGFLVPAAGYTVQTRLSVMPTLHGEKAVLRFLGHERIPALADLGFEPRVLSLLQEQLGREEGMILFAGPTGSGKTTTMYAILRELALRELSAVSIEDPVELDLPGIAQTNIDEAGGRGFAVCLRAILRQDPDVIMVGEMRDVESAKAAFQAALTGHLLLSTVHARSASEVMLRLRHLEIDELTVRQSLGLVICQRLLPKLCAACRVIDLEASNALGHDACRAVGCARCDYSGYDGRVMVAEAASLSGGAEEQLPFEEALRARLRESTISYDTYRRESAVWYDRTMEARLRPNVCMLVVNKDGLLFLGERAGKPGVWQFPQGGAEPELSDEENVLKELHEELGAEKKLFKIERKLDSTHRYKFAKPREYGDRTFDGQAQTFWLVRFLGKDSDLALDRFEPEMENFRWCTTAEVRQLAEPKRLKGYLGALEEVKEFVQP